MNLFPLVDLSQAGEARTLSSRFAALRGVFFPDAKARIWTSVLARSSETSNRNQRLRVDRYKATAPGRPLMDSIFCQAMVQVEQFPTHVLITSGRTWRVVFTHECGADAGGLYREVMSAMCAELMSDALPLFVPSPNNRGDVGVNRDHFVVNPSATEPQHLRMFRFLGVLMGLAIRQSYPLDLVLPAIFWKKLVGEAPNRGDLRGVDHMTIQVCPWPSRVLPVRSNGWMAAFFFFFFFFSFFFFFCLFFFLSCLFDVVLVVWLGRLVCV